MRGFVCLTTSERVFTENPGVRLDDVMLALCRRA